MGTHGCTGIPCAICGPQSVEARVGYGNWTSGWLFDESAGNLTAVFGGTTLTAPRYEQAKVNEEEIALYFPSQVETVHTMEPAPGLSGAKLHITLAGGHCGDASCVKCDTLERYVDGLTVRECLSRYEAWQREDSGSKMRRMRDGYLTRAQMLAAQDAWSSALRAKQAEAREKERCEVVCEEQWGEEL